MRREFSLYLDIVRLSAAMAVFLSHLSWSRLSGGFLWWLQPYGHSAVIVFFVLSGFVIQFVVEKKEVIYQDYMVARFARLWSVVVPAVVLTFVLDRIGAAHDASVYLMDRETLPALRMGAGVLFLNQSWWWNLSLMSNDAYWSLPYEFWYYMIFGAASYFKGKKRIVLMLLSAVMAGPCILLLLPIWLMGVAAYRARNRVTLNNGMAIGMFIISGIAIATLLMLDGRGIVVRSTSPYLPPSFSPIDFVTAAFVALHVFSASYLRLPLLWASKPITYAASFSFTLYLLHLPLLHFAAAYAPKQWSNNARGLAFVAFVLIAVVAVGYVTERRKKNVKQLILWMTNPLMRLISNRERLA
ncbi:MAG: acyltransferase family protein [Pseudomonadota bacterium]